MKKPNLNMKRASLLTSSLLCSALLIAVPLRKELNEGWQFKQARLSNWYPATVPGVVHTDLINNKIIEDPFFRLNERGMQWIDKEDWIYQTSFQLTPEIMERQNIDLVFKGLDTYADVYLNEKKILETNNMFREWKTDIKAELKPGENILKIYFQKDKGEFFAKSVKFKYPRQRKTVVADGVGQGYKEVQEISPNLRYVIDELDQICQRDRTEVDLKRKILDDLRHLESVVTNKISEIEADLEKLTRNK